MGIKVGVINGKQPSAGVGGVSDADLLNLGNNFLNKGIIKSTDLALSIVSGLSIQIATGNVYIPNPAGTTLYPVKIDTTQGATVPSNATGNDRYSTLVLKLDLVTTPNNFADNIATLVWVNGSSGVTPTPPSDSDIQTAVGASNGFFRLYDIYVANGAASISGANVVDKRVIAFLNGLQQADGWISIPDTLVYVSANSFKISGVDRRITYAKGTRIKLTNNNITYYGTVVSNAFATDTTVTLAPNNDFSLTNSAITSPFYSYQGLPQGYPTWFNYVPTVTNPAGATGALVITFAKFSILGDQITVLGNYGPGTIGGTITGNLYNFTLPINCDVGGYAEYVGSGSIRQGSRFQAVAFSASNSIDVGRFDQAQLSSTTIEITFNITYIF